MTDTPETFTGPYSYLEMTFEEQNKALEINNSLKPGYAPAACYLIGTRGTVKLWQKPTGEVEQFSTPVDFDDEPEDDHRDSALDNQGYSF